MMVLVSCCWEKRELETFSSVGFPFGGLICDACAVGSKFAPIYRTMRKTSRAQPWIWINANVDFSNISYLWHLIWYLILKIRYFYLIDSKDCCHKNIVLSVLCGLFFQCSAMFYQWKFNYCVFESKTSQVIDLITRFWSHLVE